MELRLEQDINHSSSNAGRSPGLAVIRVGDDPASGVYVSNKQKACMRIGIESYESHMAESITSEELIKEINLLNDNDFIDGMLLQLPLPKGLDEA